jgi:membrane associated rhomboid family serine protease
MNSVQHPAGRQPFLRIPSVVLLLVAIFVAVHLVWSLLFADDAPEIFFKYGFVPARYSHAFLVANMVNGGGLLARAIPFVSYMFLHANWGHLVGNSLWMLPFGSFVARRYGGLLFLLLFLVCGIAGAAVYLALNWGSAAPVIGASAAISGLMGTAFRILPGGADAPRLTPLWSRQVILFSVVWVFLNVVAGITGFGSGPGIHLVAWQAHLGGYFAGLLLAGPFDSLLRQWRRSPGAA